jgi:hypothetical protein
VPSVTGRVIPEAVFTPADYRSRILERIYADLARYDRKGVLRHEWVNARGAIARFERNAIEIRVIDTSECPAVDVAIAAGAIALTSALACDELAPQSALRAFSTERLSAILFDSLRDADRAVIRDRDYLHALGLESNSPCSAGELWSGLLEGVLAETLAPQHARILRAIARQGCLASRLQRRLGPAPDRARLHEIYRELCLGLARGAPFELDV